MKHSYKPRKLVRVVCDECDAEFLGKPGQARCYGCDPKDVACDGFATLADVARELGVSTSTAHFLEQRALRKLRGNPLARALFRELFE